MANHQEARMLVATQLQQDKKRHLKLLSRANQELTNFSRESERLISIKSECQQMHQQQVLMTLANREPQESINEQERLIAARIITVVKHRQQSVMARLMSTDKANDKNDELDISRYWWITPSAMRSPSKPASKLVKSLVDISR